MSSQPPKKTSRHREKNPVLIENAAGIVCEGPGVYRFRVWAPRAKEVMLKLFRPAGEEVFPMARDSDGYFALRLPGIAPGTEYMYVLDGGADRPDPCGQDLPRSPHGPCAIEDGEPFPWTDKGWKGLALSSLILYEVHIGTFTPEGTFAAAADRVPYLKELGITCLEVMPIARFPGRRNWGYDGTGLYAVHPCYGGARGFKTLVDACHRHGIAVCLDVVYNHLGPEGNYLREFGPYFTSRYQVPWGEAVNFDGPDSGPVRRFFVDNARYWVREFHVDALRLDAVHAIYDFGARHILEEINAAVVKEARHAGRKALVIAESDLNDSRLIRPVSKGGYGLAGQWSDDFHHAVHAFLTGERGGYYQDFGTLEALAKAMSAGFVYDGTFSVFRRRAHGNRVDDLPPEQLVVSIQNHDQVGNRAFGDRLGTLLPFEAQKLAAALLLLSVNTPLLFMGEEYGETAPFQYFIDHQDRDLVRLVREGRRREFAAFGWDNVPDPAAESTFLASKLDWSRLTSPGHAGILALYRDLISLRRRFLSARRRIVRVTRPGDERWMSVEYSVSGDQRFGGVFCFSKDAAVDIPPFPSGGFLPLLDTHDIRYGGKGAAGGAGLPPGSPIRVHPSGAIFGRLV